MKKVFDLKRKADNVVTSSPQQPNQPQPTNQPTYQPTMSKITSPKNEILNLFARRVLCILQDHHEWDDDTMDSIREESYILGLAHTDPDTHLFTADVEVDG
jgi:hypothetical protein